MINDIYKENIELTKEAIENLRKMPKEKQMFMLGVIKGISMAEENKPQSNIAWITHSGKSRKIGTWCRPRNQKNCLGTHMKKSQPLINKILTPRKIC